MLKILLLSSAIIVSSTSGITSEVTAAGKIDFSIAPRSSNFISPSGISAGSFKYSKPSSNSNPDDNSDYIECPMYGPFRVGDPNFEVTFTYRIFGPSRQVNERLRILGPTGSVLHAYVNGAKDYVEDSLETATFTMPIKEYLTNNGMTFKFEVVDKTKHLIVADYGATIYPLSNDKPTAQELKSGVYETRDVGFYADGKGIKGIKEKFDFTNLTDYLDVDYYYRLNLTNIKFKYDSLFDFSYDSINLRFEDRENLFPYMNHDGVNINIPLSTTKINETLTLKYKNSFYVNKRTLQLSNVSRAGYAPSTYFYLPVNGKRIFNNKLLYLDVIGLGKSKLNASFPIRYVADRSLVGLCGDSDYYIEGGIK